MHRPLAVHGASALVGPTPPALVAVAHGSRDPRSAATAARVVEEIRALRPELDVRLAFLDLNTPRLTEVLAAAAGDGHRRTVIVPLLLGSAFHHRVDVPDIVARAAARPWAQVRVADVLGADPRLTRLALRRLDEVAGPLDEPGLGVVFAATGSSHPSANLAVERLAAAICRDRSWRGCVAAFATAAHPSASEAIERLRRAGATRIAVASWFLAPGLLPERVRRAGLAEDSGIRVAAPLGADPAVAESVLDRYLAAATFPRSTGRVLDVRAAG